MTIEIILLITLGSGILAYLVGRLNKVLGAVVTIIASMFIFIMVG